MKFLKIAGKDIGDIFKNRFIRVSVIAIIIVPLLYSLLYLDAFWDPYSKLKDMPVAVVNLDEGSMMEGKAVNYGNDLVSNLKNNNAIGWRFTDEEDAQKGLEGDKYYAKLVIPEEFSKEVLAAKDGKPQVANVIFSGNEKKNFLAAQINSRLQVELKAQIVKSVSSNYVEVAFNSLYDSRDGLQQAAEGSKQLYDGLSTLNDKVPALKEGVNTLADGSSQLLNGQTTLNGAISKVSNGLLTLNDKVPTLSNGVTKIYAGSSTLKDGMVTAGVATDALAKGTSNLYDSFSNKVYPSVNLLKDGANKLQQGLETGKDDINTLNGYINPIKDASTEIAQGSSAVQDGYGQIKAGVDELITGVGNTSNVINSIGEDLLKAAQTNPNVANDVNVQAALQKLQGLKDGNEDLEEKLQGLSEGTKLLDSSITTFNNGVHEYTTNVSSFADGTGSFIGNVESVSVGVSKLSAGLDALQDGLNENNTGSFGEGVKKVATNLDSLNKGMKNLASGSMQLNTGLNELNLQTPMLASGIEALYDGSKQMESGSNKLVNGQTELNKGVLELNSNVPALAEGVTKLHGGSKELSGKLSSGAKKLKEGLKNPSKEMSEYISEPIDFKNEPINEVPNYGTGFAPYFIPLSLWIGAIMMFFVISSKTDEDATKFDKVIGKYISFATVGILQAVLVSVVVLMLGLKPTSITMFFIINVFLSLVFIAIVQCLIFLLGDVGRLLAIVLLILQLTACAGTFPLEIVPNFFKVINPFMPFTYAVESLREVISATSIDYNVILGNVTILAIVLVVFLTISVAFKDIGERITNSIEGRKAI